MTNPHQPRSTNWAWALVACLAVGHGIVDTAGNFTLARATKPIAEYDYPLALWLTHAYNVLAFAPQVLLGWGTDRTRLWLAAVVVGFFLAAVACVAGPGHARAAIAMTAVGNALFHVGAGGLTLQLARGRAAMAGVMVGPGDLGVAAGVYLGRAEIAAGPVIAAMCLLAAAGATMLRRPAFEPADDDTNMEPRPRGRSALVALAIVLLCLPIAIRSACGATLSGPYNTIVSMMIALHVAGAVSKMIGGCLADWLGWIAVAVPAAAIGAISLTGTSEAAALSGMFLVQLTMPVTLAGLSRLMPRWPGTAFGLTATTIVLGMAPGMAGLPPMPRTMVCLLQGLSAVLLLAGLLLLRRVSGACLRPRPET